MYRPSSVAGLLCSKSRECPKSKNLISRDYCILRDCWLEFGKAERIPETGKQNDVYGNKCKTLLESFISGTDKHSWLITVFGIPFGEFVTVRFQFLVTWRLRWIGRVSGPECGILVLIHTPFHSTLKPPDQVVEIPTSCSESCRVNDEKTCWPFSKKNWNINFHSNGMLGRKRLFGAWKITPLSIGFGSEGMVFY